MAATASAADATCSVDSVSIVGAVTIAAAVSE
ncbi:hypothetical protein FHR81_003391 [Actinoalloteichus hoggarensis]|nr:hypothetical protein [Actinoalloteichus hoggarensis]